MRRVAGLFGREPAGGRDPAGMAAHHFQHEHLGARCAPSRPRRTRPRGSRPRRTSRPSRSPGQQSVMGRSLSTVFGTWMAVSGIAQLLGELRDLEAGVGRVAAAVVEEVADVVRLEDLDQALVLGGVVLVLLQLVARRAERARRRVAQGADVGGAFEAGVDQVLGERAEDAVPAGVHLADAALVLAGRLDHSAGRGVDDGGDPAGLGVESVARRGLVLHAGSGEKCSVIVDLRQPNGHLAYRIGVPVAVRENRGHSPVFRSPVGAAENRRMSPISPDRVHFGRVPELPTVAGN